MGKCTANNAQITQMTDAMSDLKSLMSGGPTQLAGMQAAQDKIKEGFDILAGKNTGPMKIAYCEGFDEDLVETDQDFNPISPSGKTACLAAGGTWIEKEVENFNLHDEINKLSSAGSGAEFGTMVSDIKKKFGSLVPDLTEQIAKVSPEAAAQLTNPTIPELPKAGDPVDICTCSDPLYTDQESCEANGGTWSCKKGVMPDLSSLFSGGGISSLGSSIFGGLGVDQKALSKLKVPSIDPAKVCELCENVEVKDKVVTDPLTNKQWVEKMKETPALNPKVAEEPPAPSPPPAPVKDELSAEEKDAINALDGATALAMDSLYKGSKAAAGTAKGFDKLVKDYKDAHIYWFIQEFAKAVGGDSNKIIHASKTKVNIIFAGEAEQAARAWFRFLDGRELTRDDFDKTLKPMLFNYVKSEYAKKLLAGKTNKKFEEALKIQYNKMVGDSDAKRAADLAQAPAAFSDALKQFNMGGGFSNLKLPF